MADLIPWLTIAIGAAISYGDIQATLYFVDQYRKMGNNWILQAFLRTSATITAVVILITLAITAVFLFATPLPPRSNDDWIRIGASLVFIAALVWLAVIPILLRRYFEANEGRK